MLGALVQQVLVFLDPVLGPAWVLLLAVIVLGLGILQGLGVLEFRYLLVVGDFLVLGYFLLLVLVFLLRGWIRILRSLRPGPGPKSVLELAALLLLEVQLPSLLERQALVSMVVVQRQGLCKASPGVS